MNDTIGNLARDAIDSRDAYSRVISTLKSGKMNRIAAAADSMRGSLVGVNSWTGYNSVTVSITVSKLTGFTDPRLTGILEVFEFMSPDDTTITEYPEQLNKTVVYSFKLDKMVTASVAISATIASESPTCKRVQVGVQKGVDKPIYKIVCDDGSEPVAEPTETPAPVVSAIDAELDMLTRTKAVPEQTPAPASETLDGTKWESK